MLTDTQVGLIYKAICVPKDSGDLHKAVRINNQLYPVEISPLTGCRFIRIEKKFKFVEQNPKAGTKENLELLAKGHKIVHVIPLNQRGPWGRIMDGVVTKPIPTLKETQ